MTKVSNLIGKFYKVINVSIKITHSQSEYAQQDYKMK